MAFVGAHVGLFLAGLLFLIKGSMNMGKGKTAVGPKVRIGGLLCALPFPIVVLLAALTKSPQTSLLEASILMLSSWTGIIIAAVGLGIGMVVLYSAPTIETA
jgi:hypothetical protein